MATAATCEISRQDSSLYQHRKYYSEWV